RRASETKRNVDPVKEYAQRPGQQMFRHSDSIPVGVVVGDGIVTSAAAGSFAVIHKSPVGHYAFAPEFSRLAAKVNLFPIKEQVIVEVVAGGSVHGFE